MDFETLVQTRRSVRGYKSDPVPRSTIEEIYGALASLPHEQRHALSNSSQGSDRNELVNAALATIPAGAAWLARKAERDAANNTANAEAAARRAAEWEAGQPARVLEAIESGGTKLAPGKPKGIVATGADISAEHMELLRAYRAGVEALLAARQAANAPRTVV